jgi:hypothetical protein
MGQHMADVNLVSIVMQSRNQSNFVPADIEDGHSPLLDPHASRACFSFFGDYKSPLLDGLRPGNALTSYFASYLACPRNGDLKSPSDGGVDSAVP